MASNRYAVCHVFLSPLRGESRLFKELATAEKLFPAKELLSIGLAGDGDELAGALHGQYPYKRIRLKTARLPKNLLFQLIKYAEWTFRAAISASASGAPIIHCHSVPALPACVMASLFGRAQLLYDAHELESERAGFSRITRYVVAILEKLLLTGVSEILTVSPSIQRYYAENFRGKRVALLMNMPKKAFGKKVRLREQFNIAPDDVLVIYLGGLVEGRGIDLLLQAFCDIGPGYHLVFMGHGRLEQEIQRHIRLKSNIHIIGPVEEKDVVPTVSEADLSFSVNDCRSLNHQYSLPNKFFQSLTAGVPVMVNKRNVDMLSIGQDSGMVFGVDFEVNAIRNFIMTFGKGRQVCNSVPDYYWERQEQVLISTYRRLLVRPTGENRDRMFS